MLCSGLYFLCEIEEWRELSGLRNGGGLNQRPGEGEGSDRLQSMAERTLVSLRSPASTSNTLRSPGVGQGQEVVGLVLDWLLSGQGCKGRAVEDAVRRAEIM